MNAKSNSGTPGGQRPSGSNSFILEVWEMLRERRKFWLIPAIFALVLIGVLVVITESSVLAPFIYTLF